MVECVYELVEIFTVYLEENYWVLYSLANNFKCIHHHLLRSKKEMQSVASEIKQRVMSLSAE